MRSFFTWHFTKPVDEELQRQKAEFKKKRKNVPKGYMLHFACEEGYVKLLQHVMWKRGSGLWINERDRGKSIVPLEIAVQHGHPHCVRALLAYKGKGAIDIRTFYFAVRATVDTNNLDVMRVLLDSQLNRDNIDSLYLQWNTKWLRAQRPSHYDVPSNTHWLRALGPGHYEVASEILRSVIEHQKRQQGGNVSTVTPDPKLTTELQRVLLDAKWEEADDRSIRTKYIVAHILVAGGALSGKDLPFSKIYQDLLCACITETESPDLQFVLKHSHFDLEPCALSAALEKAMGLSSPYEAVKLLLDHASNVDYEDDPENSPLFKAYRFRNLRTFQLVLAKGPNVRVKIKDGKEIFDLATDQNETGFVQMLLDHDPGLGEIRTSKGETRLMLAVMEGRVQAVKCLLQSGASIDHEDIQGDTALHYAAASKGRPASSFGLNIHLEIIKLLITAGANCALLNTDGFAAIHLAVKAGDELAYLALYRASSSFIKGDLALGLLVLALGPPEKEQPQILRHVLDHFHVHPDRPREPDSGSPPLSWAARDGKVHSVRLLLDSGADPNFKPNNAPPALAVALMGRKFQVVELLVERGANVNVSLGGVTGLTLLHVACENASAYIVRILLNRGADPNARSADGVRPLDIAIRRGNLEVVEFLLKNGANCNVENAKGDHFLLGAVELTTEAVFLLLLQHSDCDKTVLQSLVVKCVRQNWYRAPEKLNEMQQQKFPGSLLTDISSVRRFESERLPPLRPRTLSTEPEDTFTSKNAPGWTFTFPKTRPGDSPKKSSRVSTTPSRPAPYDVNVSVWSDGDGNRYPLFTAVNPWAAGYRSYPHTWGERDDRTARGTADGQSICPGFSCGQAHTWYCKGYEEKECWSRFYFWLTPEAKRVVDVTRAATLQSSLRRASSLCMTCAPLKCHCGNPQVEFTIHGQTMTIPNDRFNASSRY